MTLLADLPFDPNVIIVLVAVVFAGIKAFLERNQSSGEVDEPKGPFDQNQDDEAAAEEAHREYEAEIERQRRALDMPAPTAVSPSPRSAQKETAPPPLPGAVPSVTPNRPKLSRAEKQALENLEKRSRKKPRPKHDRGLSTRARVIGHLSSPTAAREALVLAEVLGPPKALKK